MSERTSGVSPVIFFYFCQAILSYFVLHTRSSKIFDQNTQRLFCITFSAAQDKFQAVHYLKNGLNKCNPEVCGRAEQSGICLAADEEAGTWRTGDREHATCCQAKARGQTNHSLKLQLWEMLNNNHQQRKIP